MTPATDRFLNACDAGETALARELLLDHGADVNAQDNKAAGHLSGLHYATRNRYPDVVRLLLEAGAKVNVKDDSGRTPLKRMLDLSPRDFICEEIEGLFREHTPKAIH